MIWTNVRIPLPVRWTVVLVGPKLQEARHEYFWWSSALAMYHQHQRQLPDHSVYLIRGRVDWHTNRFIKTAKVGGSEFIRGQGYHDLPPDERQE